MRSLEQIVADNGNDNTPALDTHNLTGRANPPKGRVRYQYTITLERDEEEDYGPHESDSIAIRQVVKELQEAMDQTGLPVGQFWVGNRKTLLSVTR